MTSIHVAKEKKNQKYFLLKRIYRRRVCMNMIYIGDALVMQFLMVSINHTKTYNHGIPKLNPPPEDFPMDHIMYNESKRKKKRCGDDIHGQFYDLV